MTSERPVSPGAPPVDLSVVLPSYNEAARLPTTLADTIAYLRDHFQTFEVVVSDDGSTDGTRQVVESGSASWPEVRVLTSVRNRGKGHAVRTGVTASRGRRVLFADADGSTPIGEVSQLADALDAGADVAIGSRAVRGADATLQTARHRQVMGRVFAAFVSTALLPGIKDTQCGFKLFSREAADAIFGWQRLDGFSFDVELLYIARRLGLTIEEVPVDWFNAEGSKVDVVMDSLRMVRDVGGIVVRDFTGAYDPIAPER